MNKRPVVYLQTDKRWKTKPYRVPGETATIGGSGCGPACAAMCIETLTGKTCTPVDTCAWSVAHGYKAKGQGTYYSYFRPQLGAYGIRCQQLLGSRILNKPDHPIHAQVREYLDNGYYVIALMGPGTWTSSGHFVLVWGWDDKVRINDPASTKVQRLSGDPLTFRREVRNYWLVDAREYNQEVRNLTDREVRIVVREELAKIEAERAAQPVPDWANELYAQTIARGITDGSRPMAAATRLETALMVAAATDRPI